MVILSIDGKPVEERIAEIESTKPPSSSERATRIFSYGRLFAGPPDSEMQLALERADGSRVEVNLKRQLYSSAPDVVTDTLPSGYAYIRFDGFQPAITKEFRRALERFKNAPGIVIDLRRNSGGDLGVLLPIAGFFFDKKTLFAKDKTRSGKPLSEFAGVMRLPLELYVGKPGDQIYSGPVVILVDARSASSSEVFAASRENRGQPELWLRAGDRQATRDEGRRRFGDERGIVVFSQGTQAGRHRNSARRNCRSHIERSPT
jgi:carboxyl-terminal processing protease